MIHEKTFKKFFKHSFIYVRYENVVRNYSIYMHRFLCNLIYNFDLMKINTFINRNQ